MTWARLPQPPVDLVRAPVNMPLAPGRVVNDDEGHRSLGSREEIARDPGRGVAEVEHVVPPKQQFSEADNSFSIPVMLEATGMEREIVQGVLEWAEKGVSMSQAELDRIDARDLEAARSELQEVWGPRYQTNVEAVTSYLRALPEAERTVLSKARDHKSGKALLNDTTVLARLAGLARRPQPQAKGQKMTIEAIEEHMRTNRAAYNKDVALQAHYRQLIDQRERSE